MSSYQVDSYRPPDRDDYVGLLGKAWGHQGLSGEEFDWWFEQNPAGNVMSVARMDGNVVGVAAHTLHRMAIGGEECLMSFSVHATTHASARGLGVFTALQRENEHRAEALGSAAVLGFGSAATTPIFLEVLGWSEIGRYRIWARPVLRAGAEPTGAGLEVEGDAAGAWPNHVIRDTVHLTWRYRDSPRGYVALRSPGGYAVVWPDKPYGERRIAVLSDLVAPPDELPGLLRRVARVARGRLLFALPAPEQRRSFLAAGFLPTHLTVHLIGRALTGTLDLDPRAWRFTLGDADHY